MNHHFQSYHESRVVDGVPSMVRDTEKPVESLSFYNCIRLQASCTLRSNIGKNKQRAPTRALVARACRFTGTFFPRNEHSVVNAGRNVHARRLRLPVESVASCQVRDEKRTIATIVEVSFLELASGCDRREIVTSPRVCYVPSFRDR